ncbi:uncharacterized protein GIQ15_00246 [Arthroderma uncinatum]|uniref:uncharacterized protein n=1 Tax=Arthroderma uncinatum TaxID=74035 RepID=UPI00144A5F26|nr:uncharacterized protein GIQ15_00246 [Arthroderma uncinatum]KAF3490729.1 hypothetical protein GIQ15_00246 [Arthroderma uncinatum]
MAKDKERTVNPAQAQRRLEKQKALKKGKAEVQSRRNEKLARRNPHRIQRQIDDLKAAEEPGKPLKPQQKEILEALERDLRAVNKAREALGDKAPVFGRGDGGPRRDRDGDRNQGHNVLGKRRREGQHDGRHWRQQESSGSETDESVRRIPMPKDTPPPIPRQHFQRRRGGPNNANSGEGEESVTGGEQKIHQLLPKPQQPEMKSVYESAPVIRNLQKEAINKFVPTTVRMKQAAVKGEGQLVEPEEMDRLEKAGYIATGGSGRIADQKTDSATTTAMAAVSSLEEEEERFNRELKSVQIEEVEDEGADNTSNVGFPDMVVPQKPGIQSKWKNQIAAVSTEESRHCAFKERYAVGEKDRGAGVKDIRVRGMEKHGGGV